MTGGRTRRGSPEQAFTLLELVIFIVVAGIFVPLAYVAFSSAINEAATPESIVNTRFIAEQKMEELTKDKFADIACPVNTAYGNVPGYGGFRWKWTVGYVTCNAATNTSCAGIANPVLVDASVVTNYKKIAIHVKEPKGFEYTTSTVVTKRTADP